MLQGSAEEEDMNKLEHLPFDRFAIYKFEAGQQKKFYFTVNHTDSSEELQINIQLNAFKGRAR